MKFSKARLFLPLSAFLWAGCNEIVTPIQTDSLVKSNRSDSAKVKAVVQSAKAISENTLACFYVLNTSNARSPKEAELNNWLTPFLDGANVETISGNANLFNKGNGPMGAQVNPNADLLVMAFLKGEMDTTSLVFKINDFPISKKNIHLTNKSAEGITTCWFILPRNRYNVMLHLPSTSEITQVCQKKKLDQNQWIKNSCTLLRISVGATLEKQQLVLEDYLLATFTQ